MVDAVAALGVAKRIDEAVGIIEKLLGKLRAQPDVAALKLSMALDEIVKTYQVLDEALTAYASLALDDEALTTRSQVLFTIAGGSLGVQVEAGRGHCHKISNIYWRYLKRWFERVFNKQESEQMEAVFILFGNADDDLFATLSDLADQLGGDARSVLELVMDNDENQARRRVMETYLKVAPVQQTMAQGMKRMFALKSAFIQLATTT